MSTDADVLQTVAAWGAGVAGLVGTAAYLRRRLTRDNTEMVIDRAEGDFVGLLLKERDAALLAARDVFKEREADAEAIARLRAENENQQREIVRLTLEFSAFKRRLARLYPDTREYLATDFQPLPGPPP